jgi:histone-lysine N-methyltransferase SETMAR
MCHQGAKITSKFVNHHLSRMPHPPYSPDISQCDLWSFGRLKGILNDREFESSEQIEEAITQVRDGLTVEGGLSVFQNSMSRLDCVIGTGGEYIHK